MYVLPQFCPIPPTCIYGFRFRVCTIFYIACGFRFNMYMLLYILSLLHHDYQRKILASKLSVLILFYDSITKLYKLNELVAWFQQTIMTCVLS